MIGCIILVIIVLEIVLIYRFVKDEMSMSYRYKSALREDDSDYLNMADDIKRQKSLAELTYYKNLCPPRNNDRHLT